jgi:hypothetical protein
MKEPKRIPKKKACVACGGTGKASKGGPCVACQRRRWSKLK